MPYNVDPAWISEPNGLLPSLLVLLMNEWRTASPEPFVPMPKIVLLVMP
jgi:hypothetical protein